MCTTLGLMEAGMRPRAWGVEDEGDEGCGWMVGGAQPPGACSVTAPPPVGFPVFLFTSCVSVSFPLNRFPSLRSHLCVQLCFNIITDKNKTKPKVDKIVSIPCFPCLCLNGNSLQHKFLACLTSHALVCWAGLGLRFSCDDVGTVL